MSRELAGRRVAFLATDGVEQVELTEPWNAVREAGGEPRLVSPKAGEIQAFNHGDEAERFSVDVPLAKARAEDFDALVMPGGAADRDALRTNDDVLRFVRGFFEADKPVGATGHALGVLVEADLVKGRTLTSSPSLRTGIEEAGGTWVDREVVTDQKLITSGKPEGLAAFNRKFLAGMSAASGDAYEAKLDYMVEQSFPASDPLPPPSTLGSPEDEPAGSGSRGTEGKGGARRSDRGEASPGR